jgi:hypothetical protein
LKAATWNNVLNYWEVERWELKAGLKNLVAGNQKNGWQIV